MADRDTAMVNFRLNLSKKEDREIYDYLCKFDSPDFKAVLKGGKSNFIKTVLLSFIRKEKQEQKVANALAERKAQNEELAELLGAKLDESQRALLQALPKLLEKVVLGALEGKVVTDDTAIKGVIASSNTVAENSNDVEGSAKAGDDTGVLPQVSEELLDEAFDYFSGL